MIWTTLTSESTPGTVRTGLVLVPASPKQNYYGTPLLLHFGGLFISYVLPNWCLFANASDFLPQVLQEKNLAHWHLQYHRQCLAHCHASNLTGSTEVRECEPYMASYRHDIRACSHSYTTDSAGSRLPDKLRQVSSGIMFSCSRLGRRASLRWCGGTWSRGGAKR